MPQISCLICLEPTNAENVQPICILGQGERPARTVMLCPSCIEEVAAVAAALAAKIREREQSEA
jgi:hypothetical protein